MQRQDLAHHHRIERWLPAFGPVASPERHDQWDTSKNRLFSA
jgi:hypothetical protein